MRKIILSLVLLLLLAFTACDRREIFSIKDLKANENFDFSTDRLVNIKVQGNPGVELQIATPQMDVLMQARIDSLGLFESEFILHNKFDKVLINGELIRIQNNKINHTVTNDNSPSKFLLGSVRRYFPSKTGWSTLTFEDQWPKNGDYDMNDLIVDYRITQIYSYLTKNISQVKIDYKVRAVGAKYTVGLGFILPADRICACSGNLNVSQGFGTQYFSMNNKTLTLFLDAKQAIGTPKDKFVNTTHGNDSYNYVPQIKSVNLVFSYSGISHDEIIPYNPKYKWQVAPYNPFLYVSRFNQPLDNGRRVHLKNYPIDNLNTRIELFNTEDDRSINHTNLNKLKTYQNEKGMPWAIYTNTSMVKYPLETVDVLKVFPKFADWVNSSGNLFPDWYEIEINHELTY